MQNQKPNLEKITLYGTGIAAVGLVVGGGMLWQNVKANRLAEIANTIAQHNVDVTEHNGDRQAVKDGLMSKDNYQAKWHENGTRKV